MLLPLLEDFYLQIIILTSGDRLIRIRMLRQRCVFLRGFPKREDLANCSVGAL